MKTITIESKQSNTGTIHDLASDTRDREIKFPKGALYAVVLAACYGGKGYTTHRSKEAAEKRCAQLSKDGYSFEILEPNEDTICLFDGCEIRETYVGKGWLGSLLRR
jgi:hypothetical protein